MYDNQYARVIREDFSKYRRVIVTSDIHGNLSGFQGMLQKCGFSDADALVIVGDILEKGSDSLKLLQLVMEMVSNGNTYMLEGNNDAIFSDWYSEEVAAEDILWYVKHVPSTITEMARKLNMPYNTAEDMDKLKEAVTKHYTKEIDFLLNLPCILESDLATFVHAGMRPGNIERQDREYCLTVREFHYKSHVFDKLLVVGHWPASNYSQEVISFAPLYNEKTNVLSIDGANGTKKEGQINYLIFENGNISFDFYDDLPKVQALESQNASKEHITLVFPNTLLSILEKGDDVSLCYFPTVDKTLPIHTNTIYEYKRNTYCADVTTYRLSVNKGEVLSYCKKTEDGILVKKGNILGLYCGKYQSI